MAKKKTPTRPRKAETKRRSASGKSRTQRKAWEPPEGMTQDMIDDVLAGEVCGAHKKDGGFCRGRPHLVVSKVKAGKLPPYRCKYHGGASPGAPKGNKNALKHGIYVDALLPDETDIDVDTDDLDAEIAVTKLRLRRALMAETKQRGAEDPLEVLEETTKVAALKIMRGKRVGNTQESQVPLEITRKRGAVDYGRQINLIINQLARLVSLREVMSGGDPLDAMEKARLARAALVEAAGLMGSIPEE